MVERAADGFEAFYTERLWDWIPGYYRDLDGLDPRGGQLRALIEVVAAQAARLRRSHERVWSDQDIALCDAWAIPYIGELLGTRLVPGLDARAQRIDVAKTLYYRRRKGTLRVLEELIGDIAGWEGVVVESFRRLARTWHGLDADPELRAGPVSGVPQGAVADLRSPLVVGRVGGPFDELAHTADIRKHRGSVGRYGIERLAFHLYRLDAWELVDVDPKRLRIGTDSFLTFDPSGRDLQLFARRDRPAVWDEWTPLAPWQVPAPIDCRLLAHAVYRFGDAAWLALEASGVSAGTLAELEPWKGLVFASEAALQDWLGILSATAQAEMLPPSFNYLLLLEESRLDACGKSGLLPGSIAVEIGGSTVPTSELAAANLDVPTASPGAMKQAVIDPVRGRLVFPVAPSTSDVRLTYQIGAAFEVGAGPWDRREGTATPVTGTPITGGGTIPASALTTGVGVDEIGDSRTYGPVANRLAIEDWTLRAANQERPYVRLAPRWRLRRPSGATFDALCTLDGLWLGARRATGSEIRPQQEFERLTLRHCTLDPGGVDAAGNPIGAVVLSIRGNVEHLVIENCIVGRIELGGSGLVGRVEIRDSILAGDAGSGVALSLPDAELSMERVTALGSVEGFRIEATDCLFLEQVEIEDRQAGCFRFSAAPASSRIPRPYRSVLLDDTTGLVRSRTFGDPWFARLQDTAPRAILRGSESGNEVGAYASLIERTRADALLAKVQEFGPFGRIPLFIFAT